ncbi:MAG: hypothetical protein IPN21_04745 [Burkholderiales bacterium]|nr:hypothetical protein [Burkholderiales bacterium]
MINPDLTAHARRIAGQDPTPPSLDAADYSDPKERQRLARAVQVEIREHFTLLDRLMRLCASEAEAAAARGKPALAGEMARTAATMQSAAGKCLASAISLGDRLGELESEAEVRQALAVQGHRGPYAPLVSVP